MNNNRKIKLFLVDDDAVFLKLLEIKFLQLPDFSVETYSTGELCVANLSREPDIIILDYYLNSIKKDAVNGLEILKKARAINSDVPVVMLSVETNPIIAQNCLDHDASEFIIIERLMLCKIAWNYYSSSSWQAILTILDAYFV